MRINSKIRAEVAFDSTEAGEGLAIFLSQEASAAARYRFLVKGISSQGTYHVGEFYSSPPSSAPLGRLSRMVAGAICPGVISWSVEVSAIPSPENVGETAEVILMSSKCFTGPIGVSRVGERYVYSAGGGAGPFTFTVRAGMVVTGIGAIGLTGGGSVVINGGNTIIVPAGISANPEPKAPIPPNATIVLTNVDYVIEYLESA